MRTFLFAVALLLAATLISVGAGWYHPGAGLIVGGVLLAGWSWLILSDVDDPAVTTEASADELGPTEAEARTAEALRRADFFGESGADEADGIVRSVPA